MSPAPWHIQHLVWPPPSPLVVHVTGIGGIAALAVSALPAHPRVSVVAKGLLRPCSVLGRTVGVVGRAAALLVAAPCWGWPVNLG